MRVIVHSNHSVHQVGAAQRMVRGIRAHGHEAVGGDYNHPGGGDIAVVWGWRQSRVIRDCTERGVPLLVMERGHVQPRDLWVSLGWNGLAGRGRRPACLDGGDRWKAHFAPLMREWQSDRPLALVMGQVPGDASLRGTNIDGWISEAVDALHAAGWETRIRQHPIREPARPLGDDLAAAGLAVTFNSTSGVDALLSGVPVMAADQGSMAWPLATHAFTEKPIRPDRTAWAHRLAWANWSPAEIENGEAWEALLTCTDI